MESSTLAKTDCSRLPGGEPPLHLGHQLDEGGAGRLDAAASQGRGEQRQGAGVAVDGVDELLDRLACSAA